LNSLHIAIDCQQWMKRTDIYKKSLHNVTAGIDLFIDNKVCQ